MDNEIRCDSMWQYMNDSSNHCKDTGEGHHEMLQRIAKEKKEKEKTVAERIIKYLMGNWQTGERK